MTSNTKQFITNIQELICLLENDFESFKYVLDQILIEVVKNTKHTDAYVTFINNLLSSAATRKKGLILLRFFIPFCSNDIFEEEATAWLNNSLKNCKNEPTINDEAYKVIKPLLEICYGSPDLNRSITSGTLNKIIDNITKIHYNSDDSVNALKCLETCLRFYSGSCLPFKTSIENFILTFIDCSTSANIVRLAGRCFLALQQIGGGGTKGINHKEAWKKQQLNLTVTIHSLMDDLFESVVELGYVRQENVIPLVLPNLPNGDKNKLTIYRIINLVTYLQEMLLGAFPVAKSVYPNTILNLITRGLSITRATLGEQIISDAINMSNNLHFIHKYLLQLLQSLIVCLGCDLIPYATPICKLVINNLKLTKPKDANNVKSFCDLRIMSYQTLALWVTTAKSASCINNFSTSIIPTIFTDITPYTLELNLTVQNITSKNMSKKAKRKMQQEQITQSGIAKNYSPINKKTVSVINSYQNKICLEALDFLQIILINSGHLLKPVIHKEIQEFTVKTLFNIQRGYIPNPYNDVKCQIALYKTLTTLVTNHHWNMSPPIEYAIQLLTKGQADNNPNISCICMAAISTLNSFIHPPFPTLQFPLDIENLKDELNLDQEKRVPTPILLNGESDHDMEISSVDVDINKSHKIIEEEIVIDTEENKDNPQTKKEHEIEIVDLNNENSNLIINIENKTDEMEVEIDNNELNTSTQTCNNTNEMECTETDKDNNENSHIEISDDEHMEPLVIEEDTQPDELINTNSEQPEKSSNKNDEINIEEEDMLKSFVDVVND